MNIKLKLAITALLGTALVGCTAPNALRTETAPDQQSYEIKTVSNNPILLARVYIDQVHYSYAGDLKKVSLGIKARQFVKGGFEYKIVWKDKQGVELNPEGARWKPIELQGRETKTVQSVAPNPTAVDVVVYLKKD